MDGMNDGTRLADSGQESERLEELRRLVSRTYGDDPTAMPALDAALTALVQDAERMDWLEGQHLAVSVAGPSKYFGALVASTKQQFPAPTVREAIDAARAAPTPVKLGQEWVSKVTGEDGPSDSPEVIGAAPTATPDDGEKCGDCRDCKVYEMDGSRHCYTHKVTWHKPFGKPFADKHCAACPARPTATEDGPR